jgi:hypothetical protein
MDTLTDGLTDRQTEMTKLIVAFRNFAKATKKCQVLRFSHLPVFKLSEGEENVLATESLNFISCFLFI